MSIYLPDVLRDIHETNEGYVLRAKMMCSCWTHASFMYPKETLKLVEAEREWMSHAQGPRKAPRLSWQLLSLLFSSAYCLPQSAAETNAQDYMFLELTPLVKWFSNRRSNRREMPFTWTLCASLFWADSTLEMLFDRDHHSLSMGLQNRELFLSLASGPLRFVTDTWVRTRFENQICSPSRSCMRSGASRHLRARERKSYIPGHFRQQWLKVRCLEKLCFLGRRLLLFLIANLVRT